MFEKVLMGVGDNNIIVWEKVFVDGGNLGLVFDRRDVVLVAPQLSVATYPRIKI